MERNQKIDIDFVVCLEHNNYLIGQSSSEQQSIIKQPEQTTAASIRKTQ